MKCNFSSILRKRYFNYYTIMLLILTICFLYSEVTFAVGVKPLDLNINLKPGETKEFKLFFTPSEVVEKVNLSFYEFIQTPDGSLSYNHSLEDGWIELEDNEITVHPDEDYILTGVIKAPFNAGGSRTEIIMIEPQNPIEQRNGINIFVRYAIKIHISVDRAGILQSANLNSLNLVKGEDDQPVVKIEVENTSRWDFLGNAEAVIRDSSSRLVERINLRAPSNVEVKRDDLRIYPGSIVEYIGEVTSRLEPGNYSIRVFFRYGDHGQIIKKKEVSILENEFNFSHADKIGAFSTDTELIELQLKPGQRKSEVIKLQSEIGDESYIVISAKDVENEYEYSMLDWLNVMGKQEFKLSSSQSGRGVITFVVPKDAKSGSYHGNIVIQAFDPETKESQDEKQIPVSIIVGDEHNSDVQYRSINYIKEEDGGYLLSLDLKNTGNIKLNPTADIIITDKEEKLVEKVSVTLLEGDNIILPLQNQLLTGMSYKLTEGEYNLKITVYNNNIELKTFNETLIIN